MTEPSRRGFEVVTTRGGARAIRDLATGEVMHPGTGPGVEARELYVLPSRLEERLREGGPPLVLLDVGLGAASNALAAWRVSESLSMTARRLEIVSFENDLGSLALALEPEHAESFGISEADAEARAAASAILTERRHDTPRTSWRLSLGDLRACLARERSGSADVVFWDPYSTKVTPDLWSVASFREVRRVCGAGATLHTYSAATAVRSALLLAGFAVGAGAPSGARGETTIAALSPSDLASPLGARWLARLGRSQHAFPADVPDEDRETSLAFVRALAQFREAR